MEEAYCSEVFKYDQRLKIFIPTLTMEWDCYSVNTQIDIIEKWETIRGGIPERIREIEAKIKRKQEELNDEESFEQSCRLNEEISELASMINDLWNWFREAPSIKRKAKTSQSLDSHHHY